MNKTQSREYYKKYRRQRYYREYRKKWRETDAAKTIHRDACSRLCFRQAIKIGHLISGGWPDAGRVEQKIGTGFVTPNQWLRAAWAKGRGIVFKLLLAKTQEDALYSSKCKVISFGVYARQLNMLKEWNELVRKLKSA